MGKGSGGGTNTVTNNSAPPAEVMAQYQNIIGQANNIAGQPLQQYGGPMVAGFTPDQLSAFDTVNNAQGISAPYLGNAQNMLQSSQTPIWNSAQQWSPDAINQYMNPYQQDVTNATMANINETNAQQNQQVVGNAISKGAWGGDRAGIAQSELARQQALASNQTLAGLNAANYGQATQQFNQQQGAQIGANTANNWLASQGAFGEANLGNQAQSNALQGAAAQLATGQQQQTLAQSALNVPYEQFLQQQAYPYQNLSWLSGISTGLGSGMGGTSSSTQPSPNSTSSTLGTLGSLGQLGYLGYLAFSDRRLKDNIKRIGDYKDYPLYEFRYKGDNVKNVGVMAQDVEKSNPAAVRESGGYKMVDYSKLARGGVAKPRGFVPRYDAGGGIGGGVPNIDLSYIPSVGITRGSGLPNAPQPFNPKTNDSSSAVGALSQMMKMGGGKGAQGAGGLSNLMPDGVPSDATSWGEAGSTLPWSADTLPWLQEAGTMMMSRGGFADGGMADEDQDSSMVDLYGDAPYGADIPAIASTSPTGLGPPAAPTANQTSPRGFAPAANAYASPPKFDGAGADPINKVDPMMSFLSGLSAMGQSQSPYFAVNASYGANAGMKNYQEQKEEAAKESYQQGNLKQKGQELYDQANLERQKMYETSQHNQAGESNAQRQLDETAKYHQGELGVRREEMNKNRYKVTPFGDVIDSWTGDTKTLGVQSGADPEVVQATTQMDPIARKAFQTQIGKQKPKDLQQNNANLLKYNKALQMVDQAIEINPAASSGDWHVVQDFADRNNIPLTSDQKRGSATVVFNSDVLGNALSGLKDTFGSRPTNLDVQTTLKEMNAAPNMSVQQRSALLNHLRDQIATAANYELEYGKDIRTGKFYLPDYQPAAATDLQKKLVAPASASAPTPPANIPAGSKWSPSLKQFKDPSGKLYDASGKPI